MRPERLCPADGPAYRELMLEAYASHPDAFTSTVKERAALPLSWWEARLSPAADAGTVVFGVRDDEGLVGVVGLTFNDRHKLRHIVKLFGLYVRPRGRRSGAGARLVDAALDEARRRDGVAIVQLTVTEGNRAAVELYEGKGFAAFGTEPCAVAVEDGYVDKIHMWRRI